MDPQHSKDRGFSIFQHGCCCYDDDNNNSNSNNNNNSSNNNNSDDDDDDDCILAYLRVSSVALLHPTSEGGGGRGSVCSCTQTLSPIISPLSFL